MDPLFFFFFLFCFVSSIGIIGTEGIGVDGGKPYDFPQWAQKMMNGC
jgi:hypothetical protein